MQVGNAVIDQKLEELEGKTPYEIWKSIFSTEMLKYIVFQTNLYANRNKNNKKFKVLECEMQKCFGIILLSGYHTVPEEQQYWSTQPDLHAEIVAKTMSRNRYFEIKKYMHFADNLKLAPGNKMSKISPLYDMMNKNFVQFDIFHSLVSIDHAWATYCPRAKSGPPRLLIRPANKFSRAVSLCNISIFIYLYQYRYTFFMDIPVQTKLKTHCM